MMKFVKISYENYFAKISLNRPEVRNAFNPEMIEELRQSFLEVQTKSEIRAILFKGEGKAFCAGGDLNWMKEMINFSQEQNKKDSLELYTMFETIMNCALPIITVVQGSVFGGALGLIACSDYVIAESKTQFCFSEVKLGIAPAVISKFVLKKSNLGFVGPMMISGKVFSATEAKHMGLVHLVCDDESLNDQVVSTLEWFKEVGPEATKVTKKLIHQVSTLDEKVAKQLTTSAIAEIRVSKEGQEGLKSFLEKRKPSWRLS